MPDSLKLAMFLYILTCISVVLPITILRQIFGFVYLSFIPGYLCLRILKLGEGDVIETLVFSAGLSIAFMMFLGALLNELFLAFNVPEPLSTVPLMITISALTLIMFALNYRQKGKGTKLISLGKLNTTTALHLFLCFLLPALSIIGALYHNTLFLLLAISGIAVLWAVSIFSEKLVPETIFPLAIASTSIALLLHTALISKHLIGSDIFREFYVFKLTEIVGCWRPPGPIMSYSLIDSLNSILSITILPTIYTSILKIDGDLFFKLFYPFVFSLVPLTLYAMYRQQTDKKIALLSTLFFISTPITFYGLEPLSLTRQIVGQFFLILSMFLIVEKRLTHGKKRVLLIIFVAALIVSHYSLTYIFLFFIVSLFIVSRILSYRRGSARISPMLSLSLILLLTALTFSWYIYVSDSPLNQLLNSVHRIVSLFSEDFFSTEARFQPALTSLSPTATTSMIGMIHKFLIYLENFFIGIGIIVLTVKPNQFRLNPEFRLIAIISMLTLLLVFAVPNVGPTLNTTRFYSILIPFLAPFFVLGGIFLFRLIGKSIASRLKLRNVRAKNFGLFLVTCVLITTFLFQVGFINHFTNGYPSSYPLDLSRREKSDDLKMRVTTHSLYFVEQEVLSAKWLRENLNPESKVNADWNSRKTVLKSYALLSNDGVLPITNDTNLVSQTYTYLKYLNVRIGVISTGSSLILNISDLLPVLGNCSKIYSNGDSDIYLTP